MEELCYFSAKKMVAMGEVARFSGDGVGIRGTQPNPFSKVESSSFQPYSSVLSGRI